MEIKRLAVVMVFCGVNAMAMAGGNGTAGGEFLTMPVSARSTAMGVMGVSFAEGAEAVSVNPAGMGKGGETSVTLTHGAMVESSYSDTAGCARRVGGGAVGVAVRYQSWGGEDETGTDSSVTGDLNPKDVSVAGGLGWGFGWGNVGGTVKYVRSTLEKTASTMSGDLGYLTPGFLGDKLHGGVAVTNVGGSLTYDQESTELPRTTRVGVDYVLTKKWRAGVEWSKPAEGDSYEGVGTEYLIPAGDWGFAVRGGYSTETKDVGGATGVTVGFGVTHGVLVVDYAYRPMGDMGDTHWITLGYKK